MNARLPWLTAGVAAVAAAASAVPGAGEALELSREGLVRGEWWRIATGHLVHWSAPHALWDVATFAGIGALCERRSRRETVWALGAAVPLAALSVLALHPELGFYRGLSALDVALFALFACQLGGAIGAAFGAIVAAKLASEAWLGTALFVGDAHGGAVLVPVAHVAGASAAIAAFSVLRSFSSRRADRRGESGSGRRSGTDLLGGERRRRRGETARAPSHR